MFNNFLIDGVDNNAYGTSNQGFSNQVMQPPPDAVSEFKVVTNNESAEYGRAAGATINVAYKSGGNSLHGSVWEFNRNTALNATGFFAPPGGQKPTLDRNQYGAVARRSDRQEQGVLLRRLRRLPADRAAVRGLDDRDDRRARRNLPGGRPRPAHRHQCTTRARRFR